jgi:putative ABC transport system permease protein
MGILSYKLIHDLWSNKGRTLQVVLIIGIGAGAIGMIMGTRNLFIPGMENMWRSMHPAMINLYINGPPINEQQMLSLSKVEGVAELDAFSYDTIEWRLSPDQEWSPGGLTARIDYKDQHLNMVELLDGEWPREDTIGIENGSDVSYGIHQGDKVYLKVNDRQYALTATGVMYYQLNTPAYLGGVAQFYVTPEMYERMTGTRDFSRILVSAPAWDETAVQGLGDRVQNRLEKIGVDSDRIITDPNKHFFQDSMNVVFLLLGVLGALSLVLGLLLVYNTVNALISQQVDQIGIMKAVGARTWQIFLHYLSTILVYGLLALLVALPMGIYGARAISTWLTGSFGAEMVTFEVDRASVIVMVAVALLAPLLASIGPVWSGARTTVREAISTYGLSTGTGLLERLLARIRWISRLALVTISNTFRHKRRVILLEITLVMSGLMFMMVVSVRDSVQYTFQDVLFSILGADATYLFKRPERIKHVEEMARAYPGVAEVEMWGWENAEIRPKGQPRTEDDDSVLMLGVPLPTRLYGYQLRLGRWLVPEDGYGVVLNQRLAEDVGVGVGDWVTIHYTNKRERDWQVVGLVFDPLITNSANVPREPMLRDVGSVGRAQTAWVKSYLQDDASLIALADNLRKYFDANQVDVSPQLGIFNYGGYSTLQTGKAFAGLFNFLVILLAIMAVIIGAVGSIALSGALSLSVMERRREIGVMRAIGASSGAIFRLFIGEGLILGWLSALIAWPLSVPAGQVMVKVLGVPFNMDIQYKYTPAGALLWLGIISILSILASWLPARSATRISVRESLAYQ